MSDKFYIVYSQSRKQTTGLAAKCGTLFLDPRFLIQFCNFYIFFLTQFLYEPSFPEKFTTFRKTLIFVWCTGCVLCELPVIYGHLHHHHHHHHVLYFEKKIDRRNLTMREIKQ